MVYGSNRRRSRSNTPKQKLEHPEENTDKTVDQKLTTNEIAGFVLIGLSGLALIIGLGVGLQSVDAAAGTSVPIITVPAKTTSAATTLEPTTPVPTTVSACGSRSFGGEPGFSANTFTYFYQGNPVVQGNGDEFYVAGVINDANTGLPFSSTVLKLTGNAGIYTIDPTYNYNDTMTPNPGLFPAITSLGYIPSLNKIVCGIVEIDNANTAHNNTFCYVRRFDTNGLLDNGFGFNAPSSPQADISASSNAVLGCTNRGQITIVSNGIIVTSMTSGVLIPRIWKFDFNGIQVGSGFGSGGNISFGSPAVGNILLVAKVCEKTQGTASLLYGFIGDGTVFAQTRNIPYLLRTATNGARDNGYGNGLFVDGIITFTQGGSSMSILSPPILKTGPGNVLYYGYLHELTAGSITSNRFLLVRFLAENGIFDTTFGAPSGPNAASVKFDVTSPNTACIAFDYLVKSDGSLIISQVEALFGATTTSEIIFYSVDADGTNQTLLQRQSFGNNVIPYALQLFAGTLPNTYYAFGSSAKTTGISIVNDNPIVVPLCL